ncbi:hypothetical protein GJ496_005444 [Pomphorhynchus laevis]|nr:hypothetical protein GJ496_005444 [Pomphorhynchus laevis]
MFKEKEDLSKAVLDLKAHLIGANSRINRCSEIIKTLLIEKSEIETTNAKRKCNEDKLRLGQYIMQRQGATFVEQWVDGYAIEKLLKQQSSMNKAKEEIERERKGLLKRKPILKCNSTTAGNASTMVNKSTTQPQASDPESSNDKFYDKPLSAQEWHEREEVLRIRLAALRKEEIELQLDLEKLGRERHLHIREIKRIDHQKNSRFHNGCMLNDRYLLLSMLGRGGFSEVHKAFDCREQHYVACKVHQLNREWSDEKKANYIKHAIREYNIHKSLDHPRIVRLYDVFEIDNNSFCTVLEYCEGNDLDFVLKQSKNFPEKESRSIIMQIISGLRYLNIFVKPPVIHYDLKPGNIMVGTGSRSGEIKITDFGLSKQMDEDCYDPEHGMDLTSQGAGTYWYLPPEVFVQGPDPPKISSKVDVWSLGCMFFQCLYGRKPFGHNLSQSAILENNTILKAKEVQFPTKPPISNEAKAFIRKCLTYKVKNRPDIIQLSEDEYVQGFFRRGTSSSASSSAAALTYQQSGISSSATSSHSCKPANTLLPSQQPCQQTPDEKIIGFSELFYQTLLTL